MPPQARWNAHEFHYHSEFYADYGNYDVKLTVPKGYTVGAVGHEEGEAGGAGQPDHPSLRAEGRRGFRLGGRARLQGQDTTWTGPGSPEVDVQVIYPPEYPAVAKPIQKATTDSLSISPTPWGRIPTRRVTAVVPPYNAGEAGGMEYPTFFTAESSRSTPRTR